MRKRRTKAAVEGVTAAIRQVLDDDGQMTVRQIFYRLVAAGVIEKNELQYRVVVRLTTELRRSGRVGFDAVADNTRWTLQPTSYRNIESALDRLKSRYHRDPWQNQDGYVEVWVEKDALSGVLYQATSLLDVPLMVTRGFPSVTFLHSAAETIAAVGKPTQLLYFGDWDPSGLDINRAVEDGIREFAPDADVTVTRVAVTEEQIDRLGLPTRPTKVQDPRAAKFDGGSVELDAIPPGELRVMVDQSIRRHVDAQAWRTAKRVEDGERKRLRGLIDRMLEPE